MNKTYKVLWNKVRATHVVTDEKKTAHGKGRQGVLSSRISTAAGAGIASLMLLLAPAAMAAGSEITTPEGWSHTTVTSTNGVHNITTSASKDNVGINKFDKFSIVEKEIANLQFGGNEKLLNFVNQQIKVDGTVNAVKGGSIGGDLYFISPQGMIVGATGVINAGSLR